MDSPEQQTQQPTQLWYHPKTGIKLLLVGLGILLGLGWVTRSALPLRQLSISSPALEEEQQVSTPTVEAKPIAWVNHYDQVQLYSGEMRAQRTSELGFERSGLVIQIAVTEGMQVTAGMRLAQLDTRALRTREQELLAQQMQLQAQLQELQRGPRSETIAAAQASVQDLQEQRQLAILQQDRRQVLYAEGAISREQLDAAETEVAALTARLQSTQSQLQELQAGTRPEQIQAQTARMAEVQAGLARVEVELANSTLTAPYTGHIALRRVDEGTVVTAGQPILRLVEDSVLEAWISIPVEVAAHLELDTSHQLQVGGRSMSARLRSLLPELTQPTRMVLAVLEANNTTGIRVGETVQLPLQRTISAQGFWLPTTALVPGVQGLCSVYSLQPSVGTGKDLYQVKRQELQILHQSGEAVFAHGTLQQGDLVIQSGPQTVVPEQVVRVQPLSQEASKLSH